LAPPVVASNKREIIIADVIHHMQVAPITKGSRNVRYIEKSMPKKERIQDKNIE